MKKLRKIYAVMLNDLKYNMKIYWTLFIGLFITRACDYISTWYSMEYLTGIEGNPLVAYFYPHLWLLLIIYMGLLFIAGKLMEIAKLNLLYYAGSLFMLKEIIFTVPIIFSNLTV